MNYILLLPPVTFVVVLIVMLLQMKSLKIFSAGVKNQEGTGGGLKAYACGEDSYECKVQPDYRQFFPFAFFFTIMHVAALIIATIPKNSPWAAVLATFYLLGAAVALFILFRRK